MPLSYAVSAAENLVRVSATGIVGSADLPPMTSSLISDDAIVSGMRFVVDAENVEADLTFTDLRTAAEALRALREKGVSKMAIVTDTTHIYALAQVFAVFAPHSTVEVKVFRTGEEAASWLNRRTTGA